MSGPRIGSLCTGYGGLDQGVHAVYGGKTVWVSDIDKGACKILDHRYDVPNLGDFTVTDWSTVEPVDILTAGFPCQPVSNAGKRLGDNDERWLWDDVARAVSELRPGLVVLENVRGLLTAGSGRLFGLVLGSLADLGYDAQWRGIRAADVGAPHGRFRIFIVAHRDISSPVLGRTGPRRSDRALVKLLPTPTSRDAKGANQRGDESCLHGALQGQRLLSTPTTSAATGGPPQNSKGKRDLRLDLAERTAGRWGQYDLAVADWERTLGRTAPAPTQASGKGNPQLAPVFVEWMMGLPAGWVTDVPGVTRNEALKALGNGVVPQQAAAALRLMLDANVVAA